MSNPEHLNPSDEVIYASIDPTYPWLATNQPEFSEEEDLEAQTWSLPSADVVPVVVKALRQVLAANGLGADDVVVSGYNRLETSTEVEATKAERYSDENSVVAAAKSEVDMINDELRRLHEDGTLTDSKKAEAHQKLETLRLEIRRLEAAPAVAEVLARNSYHFAALEALDLPGNSIGNNAVYYAGGYEGATLGVYSRQVLAELGSNTPGYDDARQLVGDRSFSERSTAIYEIRGTRAEIEAAKLVEVHLRYGDFDQ